MFTQPFRYSFIFIALYALSTGVGAQNIYKCGDSYSETPCPGATTIKAQDPRLPAQKKQTDAATKANIQLASKMQKERLAEEKLAAPKTQATTPSATAPTAQVSASATVLTPKRIQSKSKKPDQFIAEIPGTEKQNVRKTASPKASAP